MFGVLPHQGFEPLRRTEYEMIICSDDSKACCSLGFLYQTVMKRTQLECAPTVHYGSSCACLPALPTLNIPLSKALVKLSGSQVSCLKNICEDPRSLSC